MPQNRKTRDKNPFDECEWCETIADCPHPTVDNDNKGTPIPPDECPKPMAILKATRESVKLNNLRHIHPD